MLELTEEQKKELKIQTNGAVYLELGSEGGDKEIEKKFDIS